MNPEDKELTYKEKAYAEFFTTNGFIGWRAAQSAGYQGSKETLYVRSSENLAKPHVKAYIKRRMDSQSLDSDQVIAEVSSIAKGEVLQYIDEDGTVDLQAIKDNGLVRNVESISTSTSSNLSAGIKTTKTTAKFASRSHALRDLLKVHDKIKPQTVIHVVGWKDALDKAYGDEEEVNE